MARRYESFMRSFRNPFISKGRSRTEGYAACRMAMEVVDAPHPYFAMIGNIGGPTWSDTAISYLAFYHLLAKGKTIPESVEAMRVASGDHGWVVETAEATKQSFVEYLKSKVERTCTVEGSPASSS